MVPNPDLDDILAPFHLSKAQLEEIISKYQDEFEVGLRKGPPEATVAMLPSFLPELPDGTEQGRYLGLDLGGTNLRVLYLGIIHKLRDTTNQVGKTHGLKVRVRAIMNDAVGHLISAAYEHGPGCTIAAVVSTGCNASYLETTGNIIKINPGQNGYKYSNMIIDTEWEEFGNMGQLDFIQTQVDRAVDLGSVYKGKQTQDKYISGLYMGELARLLLLEAEKAGACGGVDNPRVVGVFSQPSCFTAKHVSEVLKDDLRAGEFNFTKSVLTSIGYKDPPLNICRTVCRVCYAVSDRSAGVLAAALSALIKHTGTSKVKIGLGGSLYEKHSMYPRLLRQRLSRLLPLSVEWELVFTKDGSGKGAALAVALAEKLDL